MVDATSRYSKTRALAMQLHDMIEAYVLSSYISKELLLVSAVSS
jgi:hypothetical protein